MIISGRSLNFIALKLSMLIWLLPAASATQTLPQNIQPAPVFYFPQNLPEALVDSASINPFLESISASDNIKKQVCQFYKNRSFSYAWVIGTGLTTAASNFYNQVKSDSRDFDDKSLNNAALDTLFETAKANEKAFMGQKNKVQQLELLFTASFFIYAGKMYGGITKESKNLEWYIPRKKKNYQSLLDSLVLSTAGKAVAEPVNEYYIRLKEKLKEYRAMQQKGGFVLLATSKKLFSKGDTGLCIVQAKQQLSLEGDLTFNDHTNLFTDTLLLAIKSYQHRMGLGENGKLDAPTMRELNVPVAVRLQQIMVNLERLRWAPVAMEKDYLLVNIPEFKLHIFEDNKQVWATNVVVGKAVRQTSIFRDDVSQIILNPYWNVPSSITRKEILPHIRKDPSYLTNNNMEVVSNNPFVVRQKPGSSNALGKMKFLLPNNYNVYLHDTPSKGLFGETKRAFSHGCIRVENPEYLALYLLRKDTSWSKQRVDEVLQTDKETGIKLKPAVPVYIAYFTAWVDNTGQLNFRNDVYGLDKKLSAEIFGK